MFAAGKKSWRTSAAVEITRSWLHLAVIERQIGTDELRWRSRSVRWRHDSRSVYTEQGVRELGVALTRLSAEERLTGQRIDITLNGDLCVTRVVAGQSDAVRRELSELEHRAQLYLRLGNGRKALAADQAPLDTRHQHALLAVANERTLRALIEACDYARLEIGRVEPSLVALSRAIGAGGLDADGPVVVINGNGRGVELGISHRGRLLLDYRPASSSQSTDVADIVAEHWGRLEKYFGRHFGYTGTRLGRVYICGPDEVLTVLGEGFSRHPKLSTATLTPQLIDARLTGGDHQPPTDRATWNAALGTCLLAEREGLTAAKPDLMAPIHLAHQDRFLVAAAKCLWPAAAAILVAVGVLGWSLVERYRSEELRDRMAELEPLRTKVLQLRGELVRADAKTRYLREIAARITPPRRTKVLANIAGCMPDEVWLDRLEVDGAGKALLSGVSLGEDPVFEFVRGLGAVPGVKRVQVESTAATRLAQGVVTKFEIKCDFTVDSIPDEDAEKSRGSNPKTLSDKPFAPTNRHNPIFADGFDGGLVRGR